jgi:hypothetical protein
MTAEDALPANTQGVGEPDPPQESFDTHFGYGRANLGAAAQRISNGAIPPGWWSSTPGAHATRGRRGPSQGV